MTNEFLKIIETWKSTSPLWAVAFGTFIQFWLGSERTSRMVFTLIICSLFLALYAVPLVVRLLDLAMTQFIQVRVTCDGAIAMSLYAFSAITSRKLIEMLTTILPSAMEHKVKEYIGMKEKEKEKK